MRGGSVAKRYATALLGVAQETGSLDKIQEDLNRLIDTVGGNRELRSALESPVVPGSQKKAIIAELQNKLQLDPFLVNLTKVLIDQDRMDILPLLGLLFRDMADEKLGQVRVQIRVATELGAHEAKLKEVLEKSLGLKVLLETTVDPELMGGLSIRVADRVFDASLKHELEKIKAAAIAKAVA